MPRSLTAPRRRARLTGLIIESFEESDETYGYRRIHAQLARQGVPCGPELVRSIMRELGLQPCQPRPRPVSLTAQDDRDHHIPDLINRDFTAERPGTKLVGDITYVPTWEGWLYLATVIDCHTKMVIGVWWRRWVLICSGSPGWSRSWGIGSLSLKATPPEPVLRRRVWCGRCVGRR